MLADLGVRARLVCRLHTADLYVVLRVRRVRDPLSRVARRRLLEHAVDLLQTEALCLGDEQVSEQDAEGTRGAPDEEDLGLEVAVGRVHEIGRDEADDEVPEPVGVSVGLEGEGGFGEDLPVRRGGESYALGADG